MPSKRPDERDEECSLPPAHLTDSSIEFQLGSHLGTKANSPVEQSADKQGRQTVVSWCWGLSRASIE